MSIDEDADADNLAWHQYHLHNIEHCLKFELTVYKYSVINSSNLSKKHPCYSLPAEAVRALHNCLTTQGVRTQGTIEATQAVLLG